jgi:LuxR family maltose regulon positive regulatory protein
MAAPLLNTKLCIPPIRPNRVPRPHLIERLSEGLRLNHRLTLVSAPPGFGKTTLIGEWVGNAGRPVAWFSIDETDNDPVVFLSYLISAFQQVDQRIGQMAQTILLSPHLLPMQGPITSLINDLTAIATPIILVLDDYHLITSMPVHQALGFLLEHQPPSLHLVVGTREDPPLPLARLRARGQMTEIREHDLRFTVEEAAVFLNQIMGLGLPEEAIRQLEARTEGWIAGLQLAALALQRKPDGTEAFVTTFTGSDRYVMEYLITEVLQRLPEDVHVFLRKTAILDQLTAPLCDELTGRDDSRAILERLEGANLFLIPLDRQKEWYRYHRLFAEFLRMGGDYEEQKMLHQKAMRWYEAHGLVAQAVHHAMAYASMSGDWSGAERLVRQFAETALLNGNLLTALGWLDTLPEEHVRADIELATCKGWALALTNEMIPAESYASAAEGILSKIKEAPPVGKGRLLVLRAFIEALEHQNYESAIALALQALEVLQETHENWRVIALWVLAESLERTRPISEAIDAFYKALQTGLKLGKHIFVATVEMSLALSLNNHGQRLEAIRLCEDALRRYKDSMGNLSPAACLILSRLGLLYYESNQLEQSREFHEKCLELGKILAPGDYLAFAEGSQAPTLFAQGDISAALEALRHAYHLAGQSGYINADTFLAMEADFQLKQGNLEAASRWAEEAGLSPDDIPQYMHIEQHVVYARLLLAQQRLPEARRWLTRLEQFCRERELYRWLISVHILQALVAERIGEHAVARTYLSEALRRAAPENYIRAFLDEDRQVIGLLPEVRDAAPAFVEELLRAARQPRPSQSTAGQPLFEPLSERELEVLSLVADGLSNAEIAHKLFIAVGTVKRHINNIYGKLEVTSRTQAVAKARQLKLLQ